MGGEKGGMGRSRRRGNVAGGAKGATWCGVAAPKEIPFEDIMIPENGPTVPAWFFLFARECTVSRHLRCQLVVTAFEKCILPPFPLLISHVVRF